MAYVGFALAVVAAAMFGVTVAIQKYSLGESKSFSARAMATNRKWLLALAIGAVGSVIYIQALSMEALSTVQPLMSSISMLVPVFIGAFMFKEKMGGLKWLLAGMVVLGIIILGL